MPTEHTPSYWPPMGSLARLLFRVAFLYACWLGMMAVHEFGHVLHARLSGGRVALVTIPLLGFSRTDLAENPRPLFVAAGGAVWGCAIPLILYGTAALLRLRGVKWLQFFAGFCLVANGTYIAIAAVTKEADGADLLRHGAPQWVLVSGGVLATVARFYLWHRLGVRRKPSFGTMASSPPDHLQ